MQELQEQDNELIGSEEAPYVGQIVPPPTYVNATMGEKLDISYMAPARPGAEDHRQYKSRGF